MPSSPNGKISASDILEAERAKASFCFRESLAPGLCIEMDLKAIWVSTQSPYQKIDVIETFFGRTLVTDGKTQSAQFDEFAYHESLVHPALLKALSTGNAKTVFIGGGGELATAREVLKHKNVERVVMVDLDKVVVDVCRKYLPEWGGDAVANDPRLELRIGDAYEFLMNTDQTFDAIIMDISDPIEAGPGVMLYTKEFYEHAKTLLHQPHGVFVTQAGTAEAVPSVDESGIDASSYAAIANTLEAVFDSVVPYSASIPSFGGNWGFVLAHFGNGAEANWKAPQSGQIDSLIDKHITGGSDALKWYDEATHLGMFHLSKPLRKCMEKESRIMTKNNPIFMY